VPQKIVVGIDGSDTSRRALAWAFQLAKRRHAHLDVVNVWHYPASSYPILGTSIPWPAEADMHASATERMATFLDECKADTDLDTIDHDRLVRQGRAGPVLCDMAEGADLLVVGSRGLGGFKGLILGAVGAYCANAAPTAVAVVPGDWDPRSSAHDDIVIGVDGSPNSIAAVRWADEWSPDSTKLRVMSAWSYPVSFDGLMTDFDSTALEEACLNTAAAAADLIQHHAHEASCIRSDARVALPKAADHADMLVIGARGHGGLGRMLLGSVASSIVHHLTVPTVLVPASEN
jgi:nucleotide-binding universal stress UspA family protein